MTSPSVPSHESASNFSHQDFAEALEQHDYRFERGQVVRGKVCEHASEGVYVDIGGKSQGFVPVGEISSRSYPNMAECLPLDEQVEFLIVREQNAEGQVTLSRRLLEIKQSWERVADLADSGESVQLRVNRTNKGGVIGEVEGLRGFIPRSHLIEKDDLDSLVGQILTANFLEVDQERNRLILSQRQFARAAAISKLEKGQLQTGKVVKIQPYGIFVDLAGVTGLLHITQISNVRVEGLSDIFEIGQTLSVFVLDIDEYKNRVSLSTKVLEQHPGEVLEDFDAVMSTATSRAEMAREKLAEAEAAKNAKKEAIQEEAPSQEQPSQPPVTDESPAVDSAESLNEVPNSKASEPELSTDDSSSEETSQNNQQADELKVAAVSAQTAQEDEESLV